MRPFGSLFKRNFYRYPLLDDQTGPPYWMRTERLATGSPQDGPAAWTLCTVNHTADTTLKTAARRLQCFAATSAMHLQRQSADARERAWACLRRLRFCNVKCIGGTTKSMGTHQRVHAPHRPFTFARLDHATRFEGHQKTCPGQAGARSMMVRVADRTVEPKPYSSPGVLLSSMP